MANLYENIQALCQRKGIRAGKMCNDLGISRSMISDLKYGRRNSMTNKNVQKIAEYLGTTTDAVINGIDSGNEVKELLQTLRDEDRALLQVARDMTPEQVASMTAFAKQMKGEAND